jgi:hypothetical protein
MLYQAIVLIFFVFFGTFFIFFEFSLDFVLLLYIRKLPMNISLI